MSKRLSSLLLFHSNFPNIWEQREPECNWSSAARICFRWIFMCQQSTSLECLPSSIVSRELNGSKKKALWGVSCKLCITAQRPGLHFCKARLAAVKFRQGREGNVLLQPVWERQFSACCSSTPPADAGRAQREEKLPPRSLLQVHTWKAPHWSRWWSADVISAKRSKLSRSTFCVCVVTSGVHAAKHTGPEWDHGTRGKGIRCAAVVSAQSRRRTQKKDRCVDRRGVRKPGDN